MITLVDIFQYPPKDSRPDLDIGATLSKGYKADIDKMRYIANFSNRNDADVTLTVRGNTKTGILFNVNCDDAETKEKISQRLNQYLKSLDDEFGFDTSGG